MMFHMYDNEEDEYEDEEINVENLRSDEFNAQRGKDDRAFFDDLAKKEDERHNAMRADLKKRTLMLGESQQKLRHKKTELHGLEMRITQEEDAIAYEAQKAYRVNATEHDPSAQPIPILSKDIGKEDSNDEFSISRAEATIKQLQEEKLALEKVISEMSVTVSEEERALSQLQHTLLRM